MLADTPFETTETGEGYDENTSEVLTGHVGAGLELGGHLGVHGDQHLLLGAHDGVALLHLVGDPGLELTTEDHGAHVDDPLLRHLLQVDFVRQEV